MVGELKDINGSLEKLEWDGTKPARTWGPANYVLFVKGCRDIGSLAWKGGTTRGAHVDFGHIYLTLIACRNGTNRSRFWGSTYKSPPTLDWPLRVLKFDISQTRPVSASGQSYAEVLSNVFGPIGPGYAPVS